MPRSPAFSARYIVLARSYLKPVRDSTWWRGIEFREISFYEIYGTTRHGRFPSPPNHPFTSSENLVRFGEMSTVHGKCKLHNTEYDTTITDPEAGHGPKVLLEVITLFAGLLIRCWMFFLFRWFLCVGLMKRALMFFLFHWCLCVGFMKRGPMVLLEEMTHFAGLLIRLWCCSCFIGFYVWG